MAGQIWLINVVEQALVENSDGVGRVLDIHPIRPLPGQGELGRAGHFILYLGFSISK